MMEIVSGSSCTLLSRPRQYTARCDRRLLWSQRGERVDQVCRNEAYAYICFFAWRQGTSPHPQLTHNLKVHASLFAFQQGCLGGIMMTMLAVDASSDSLISCPTPQGLVAELAKLGQPGTKPQRPCAAGAPSMVSVYCLPVLHTFIQHTDCIIHMPLDFQSMTLLLSCAVSIMLLALEGAG